MHLPPLIVDLAFILAIAGVTTFLFRWLRQPVVLGYILAGLLVGPNVPLVPTVTEIEGVRIWGEIGVIFLLFSMGLEFGFRKLTQVGGAAAINGLFEISMMLLVGFSAGRLLGWPLTDSLFLAGIMAISSTTIIFRAFDELGLKTMQFTNLVLGVLIIEDLLAVLLMVLLSTLSVSMESANAGLLLAVVKPLFFVVLWFLMGIFLVPTLFRLLAKWLTPETMLIASLGLCFGMVVFANKVGFSAALGAFVMGSIFSETVYAEKIEHLVEPVKHLFGAIFFVSVGMLINPAILYQYAAPIALITVLVILGKLLFVTAGAVLAGKPLNLATQAGASMTQIGEFSFIIAALGNSLGVTGNYLYPVAVGVSVITTFLTPYSIKLAGPYEALLQKVLPASWLAFIDNYSSGAQIIKGEGHWQRFLKAYLQTLIINTVIVVSIILLCLYFLSPLFQTWFQHHLLASSLSVLVSLAAMAPFLWALMARPIQGNAYRALWLDSKYNRGPLVMLEVTRNLLAVGLVGILLALYFSPLVSLVGVFIITAVVWFVFRSRLQHFYQRIESRFLSNLDEKQTAKLDKRPRLTPWDAHITGIHLSPQCSLIGKPLEEIALRERFGVNIAYIERGNRVIYAPSRYEMLFPGDEIGVLGTDEQLKQLSAALESPADNNKIAEPDLSHITLEKIIVDAHNGLTGKTIRESGIREFTNGLVVGIERSGERMLNPASNTVFEWDDVIWIVGDRRKIDELAHQGGENKLAYYFADYLNLFLTTHYNKPFAI
jgi:CPA2 family monovalent cation:H+ antiporter-2